MTVEQDDPPSASKRKDAETEPSEQGASRRAETVREERLAEALRANLRRRKAGKKKPK